MSRRRCTVYYRNTGDHVSQVHAGFTMLARAGEIDLRQTRRLHHHQGQPLVPPDASLYVHLDERLLFYDAFDSSSRLHEPALEIADAYFKRCFSAAEVPERFRDKVFPLGLTYPVYADRPDVLELRRVVRRDVKLWELRRYLARAAFLRFRPSVSNMCAPPDPGAGARVLFRVRAWEPDAFPADLPEHLRQERREINAMRAQTIDSLRAEFGSRFHGGFIHTAYAVQNFPNQLVTDDRYTALGAYIGLLRRHPICIATSGLHGSVGFKVGEYVSFSKAIVSEPLRAEVPGDFEPGRNYLEFRSPEEVVEAATRLASDQSLRAEVMESNWRYYREYVAPDRYVARTLDIAAGV